ncbi:MAG: hypothetical protein ABFR32_07620 [Bacteroidota bacterium]
MSKFLKELKRRNVFKAAIAYLVVTWILLQLLAILLPIIETPDWVLKTLTLLMALGFPIWIIFSWVYEITPEGMKKTSKIPKHQSITAKTNKRLNILIFITLIAAIAISFFNRSTQNNKSLKASNSLIEKSIAVLPFNDLSSSGDTEWFCDGVTEDILTNLAKLKEIKVISRTSTERYRESDKSIPEIAKELGVSYLLEGSVRKQNDRVLITAQLINANDEHLWADNYSDNIEDVFKIQQDVSKKIVKQLQVAISPEEEKELNTAPTNNIEAYQLYLKGRVIADNRTKIGLQNSIRLYQKAIDLDPNYAEAYAEMSNSYFIMTEYQYMDIGEGRIKINKLLEKALSIDPNSARAFTVKANLNMRDSNWDKAEKNFKKAIYINPNDATAHHHYATYFNRKPILDAKNWLLHIDIAQQLDPFSIPINLTKLYALIANNKIDESEAHYNKISFLFNEKDRFVYEIGVKSLKKKDWMVSIRLLEEKVEKEPNNPTWYILLGNYQIFIMNDRVNGLRNLKIAYEIDSTDVGVVSENILGLILDRRYVETKNLLERKDIIDLLGKHSIDQWHGFNNYTMGKIDEAMFYYNKSVKKDPGYKAAILSKMGNKIKIYELRANNQISYKYEAIVYANLKDRDSMYYFLSKMTDILRQMDINSSPEFDLYRNEPRFKTFLKNNYLPVNQSNE